ncbi:MAG TPA: hypothetical protein VGL77_13650 [Armatimonadota bacterium]|jgi:hypothetical protein
MPYASLTQLADYLGVDVSTLTSNDARLLERATSSVRYLTSRAVAIPADPDTATTDKEIACRDAVCAQVEFWRMNGEALAFEPGVAQETHGKVQIQFAGGERQRYAPRLIEALSQEGLLYAGRNVR